MRFFGVISTFETLNSIAMTDVNECISRVSHSVFTCPCCDAPLDYVQLLNDDKRIQEDFFVCEKCGSRIESVFVEEEDVPAFYD